MHRTAHPFQHKKRVAFIGISSSSLGFIFVQSLTLSMHRRIFQMPWRISTSRTQYLGFLRLRQRKKGLCGRWDYQGRLQWLSLHRTIVWALW